MTILDRMLLRNFLKAWAVCFCSLVGLYIVIDLFNKVDEFVEASDGTSLGLVRTMGIYYGYQLVLIFDRLCGVIVLQAGMFTIAWMQRNNELVPLLSAGIPMRRVLRPVFLGTALMLGLSLVNREAVMPRVAEQLQNPANDPHGEKLRAVSGAYEPNGILIAGQTALRKGRVVNNFTCTVPDKIAADGLCNITAKEARYIPKGPQEPSGGWLLTDTTPRELDLARWKEPVLEVLDPGKFFLRTERVDFDVVTRSRTWFQFASTWSIVRELQKTESTHLAAMAVQMHLRLTLPLLTFLMVVMGVALILRDQCRNVFINAGFCLILSAVFYVTLYLSKQLGDAEYLSPPLAAWLPVMIFGPLALALVDAMHT
jgi:lipopolysaccharide export system permease protein